jgi:hypothetical protein
MNDQHTPQYDPDSGDGSDMLGDPIAQIRPSSKRRKRRISPELVTQSNAFERPTALLRSTRDEINPVIELAGDITENSSDYNVLYDVGALRIAADFVHIAGRNDQNRYASVDDLPNLQKVFGYDPVLTPGNPVFSTPNWVLGFALQWTVSNVVNVGTFDMTVDATGWTAEAGQVLDRQGCDFRTSPFNAGGDDFSAGTLAPNSGVFAMLFAQRQAPTNTPLGVPPVRGGMNLAIPQPAYMAPFDEGAGIVPGQVRVTLPASVFGDWSGTLHLLTAASPWTAMVRKATGVDTYAQPSYT